MGNSAYYPEYRIQDPVKMGYDLIHDTVCITKPADTDWVKICALQDEGKSIFQRGKELMIIYYETVAKEYQRLVAHYYDTSNTRGFMHVHFSSPLFPKGDMLMSDEALQDFWAMVKKRMRQHNTDIRRLSKSK